MPAAHTNQTPTSGDIDNGAAITTGVRFTVDSELSCAGIAFWVPSTNSGTYTVGLYQTTADDVPIGSGTGTQLATASVAAASVTADGWAQALFAAPVTLSPGVVYTAARHASSGRYVASTGVFTAAGISGNGVNLLQDGVNPNPPDLGAMRNGIFNEAAALAYPASQFGQPDYFVDIALAAEPGEEAMAAAQQVSVTTTATLLDINTTAKDRDLLIRNRGSVAVYLGGPGVATNTGFQLDPGEAVSVTADDGYGAATGTYGIVATGTATVHVLQVG